MKSGAAPKHNGLYGIEAGQRGHGQAVQRTASFNERSRLRSSPHGCSSRRLLPNPPPHRLGSLRLRCRRTSLNLRPNPRRLPPPTKPLTNKSCNDQSHTATCQPITRSRPQPQPQYGSYAGAASSIVFPYTQRDSTSQTTSQASAETPSHSIRLKLGFDSKKPDDK